MACNASSPMKQPAVFYEFLLAGAMVVRGAMNVGEMLAYINIFRANRALGDHTVFHLGHNGSGAEVCCS